MQEWLLRAAKQLGLRVEIGISIMLADSQAVSAEALFPDLGAPNGTLVFRSPHRLNKAQLQHMRHLGFTASAFREPLPQDQFDIASYERMFSEWGWAGEISDKPIWMDKKVSSDTTKRSVT